MTTRARQVSIEIERPRIVCGRREWFVMRLSFPSEHRAHCRARQLAREPEARTVRVVIAEPDGHVSRYTYKSRFPPRARPAALADPQPPKRRLRRPP